MEGEKSEKGSSKHRGKDEKPWNEGLQRMAANLNYMETEKVIH